MEKTVLEVEEIEPSTTERELVEAVLKAGSYISMCENKRINPSTLLTLLFENEHYREVFLKITCCETLQEAVLSLLYLHPSLIKSKNTKALVQKINSEKKRRAAL